MELINGAFSNDRMIAEELGTTSAKLSGPRESREG